MSNVKGVNHAKLSSLTRVNQNRGATNFDFSKGFIDFVIKILAKISEVFKRTKCFNQEEVIKNLYYNEKNAHFFLNNRYYNFINKLEILGDTHRFVKDYQDPKNLDIKNYKVIGLVDEKEVVDATRDDAVSIIALKWVNNEETTVIISSIHPLLNNRDFLDAVFELGGKFISKDEPYLSQQICSALNYLSKKKEIIKYGDPKIGVFNTNIADEFACEIGPIMDKMEEQGIKSVRAKASELNSKKIKTLRGKEWSKTTVQRTNTRWQKLKEESIKKPNQPKS